MIACTPLLLKYQYTFNKSYFTTNQISISQSLQSYNVFQTFPIPTDAHREPACCANRKLFVSHPEF